MSQGNELNGGRELTIIRNELHPMLGSLLDKIIDGVNRLARNVVASNTSADLPAPDPVNSTEVKGVFDTTKNQVTCPGEILHFVHTHNSSIKRGIQYVTEISANDPNFTNPHPVDTGASRSGFVHLPANDDVGNPVPYYLRVTPQHQGSLPAKPTVYGTLSKPTTIWMTGITNMTLLTSQGAGTARPGQGGQALGKVSIRPAIVPSQAVKS